MDILFFLISVVACVLLCLTAGVFLVFWYERLNTPSSEIPQPAFTIKNVCWFFLRFLSVEGMRLYALARWFMQQKNKPNPFMAEKNLTRPPIVLVHGIHDTQATWFFMANALEKAGFRVITFQYSTVRHGLEKAVSDFNEFMYLTEASFPNQKLLLMGHSLGGVVLRTWLAEPGNDQRAAGLITLCTPHKGSKLAVFGQSAMARCLIPGSDTMRGLEQASRLPFPCLAIFSGSDEMVVPAAHLLPPDGWKRSIIDNVGHLDMLYRNRSIEHVLHQMNDLFPHGSMGNSTDKPHGASEPSEPHQEPAAPTEDSSPSLDETQSS